MDDPVSAVELRLHVERIADHAEFRESPRHRQLLRYLANHAIATGGRSVSPQAIEADVLARSAGGRTRALTPATVMVSDLRDKLARYAAEAGRGDEVRITIPRRDCRLEVTRVRPATPPERAALPPGTPRPLLMVVEFDAEPAVCSLAKPLATAISLRLGDSHAVIPAVSRREIAARGLAVEHAPAAWDADAAVHGMLMALPGEQDSVTALFLAQGAFGFGLARQQVAPQRQQLFRLIEHRGVGLRGEQFRRFGKPAILRMQPQCLPFVTQGGLAAG